MNSNRKLSSLYLIDSWVEEKLFAEITAIFLLHEVPNMKKTLMFKYSPKLMMEINSISEKSRGSLDEEEGKSVFDCKTFLVATRRKGASAVVIKRIIVNHIQLIRFQLRSEHSITKTSTSGAITTKSFVLTVYIQFEWLQKASLMSHSVNKFRVTAVGGRTRAESQAHLRRCTFWSDQQMLLWADQRPAETTNWTARINSSPIS